MNLELADQLDPLLREVLLAELRAYVERVRQKHGTTQQQIEDALGVTRSYLSHVLGGRNPPSATLVKMLRLFAEVPGAFENALGMQNPNDADLSSGDDPPVSASNAFVTVRFVSCEYVGTGGFAADRGRTAAKRRSRATYQVRDNSAAFGSLPVTGVA